MEITALSLKKMENEDLIKKLENIDLPEVEIGSHKRRLKMALFNSGYFQKRRPWEVFKRSFVLVLPTFAVLMILSWLVVKPKFTEIRILNIAKNDPAVLKLMEEKGIALNEIKIKDGKAYILMNLPEKEEAKEEIIPVGIQKEKDQTKNVEGAIVEVNLNQKKVSEIKMIKGDEVSPLDSSEKEEARRIAEEEEIVKEIIPREAKIEEVKSVLPQKLNLIERNEKVEAVRNPLAEKRAWVRYTTDGKEWMIRVNLDKKKVEEIKVSSRNRE